MLPALERLELQVCCSSNLRTADCAAPAFVSPLSPPCTLFFTHCHPQGFLLGAVIAVLLALLGDVCPAFEPIILAQVPANMKPIAE